MEYRPLENLEGKRLLLASHSPRRRELLGMLGVDFGKKRRGVYKCNEAG